MQSLNIKGWKLLELRLYEPDNFLAFYRKNVYVQDPQKWILFELQITQARHQLSIFSWKNV